MRPSASLGTSPAWQLSVKHESNSEDQSRWRSCNVVPDSIMSCVRAIYYFMDRNKVVGGIDANCRVRFAVALTIFDAISQ